MNWSTACSFKEGRLASSKLAFLVYGPVVVADHCEIQVEYQVFYSQIGCWQSGANSMAITSQKDFMKNKISLGKTS